MNETPIYLTCQACIPLLKLVPEKHEWRGSKGGKKRVIFVVTCAAARHILKPMVVFKGKTACYLKTVIERSGIGIVNKAWITISCSLGSARSF